MLEWNLFSLCGDIAVCCSIWNLLRSVTASVSAGIGREFEDNSSLWWNTSAPYYSVMPARFLMLSFWVDDVIIFWCHSVMMMSSFSGIILWKCLFFSHAFFFLVLRQHYHIVLYTTSFMCINYIILQWSGSLGGKYSSHQTRVLRTVRKSCITLLPKQSGGIERGQSSVST